jgi:hypothetical protein
MKNIVYVIVDTDKDEAVTLGKPEDFQVPQTQEDDIRVCEDDIKTLTEGIIKIMAHMDTNDYIAFEDVMESVSQQMGDGMADYLQQKANNNQQHG